MAMSRTGALSTAELELVEVEVESVLLPESRSRSRTGQLSSCWIHRRSCTDPTPLEKPVAAGPPPQAVMASRATVEREARMRASA
jgi:hypothetical protein